jgi:hypothetical protein
MSLDITPKKKASLPDVPFAEIVALVERMKQGPTLELPLQHQFTPGMYSRTLFVPAGAHIVTKVHRVEHQFVVSAGKVLVWSPGERATMISAPYIGVTKPGTIRLALVVEDLVWTTFHPTDKTTVEEVEKDVVFEPKQVLEDKEKQWLLSQ